MMSNILTRGVKALQQMLFPQAVVRWATMPRTRYNYQAEVGDGSRSSIVMASINWMARTFPEAPLVVESTAPDGTTEVIPTHPLTRLLEQPNPFYSGFTLWMATLQSWVLDGNAYWLKTRGRAGGTVELWWTPHWLIAPAWPKDGSEFITHYEYRPNDRVIRVDPADVVHFRYGLDPDNQRKGQSPLKAVVREIFTDDEAANFSSSLLRNMGVPGIVVSPGGDRPPSKEELDTTKEYFLQQFTGDKRGDPIVMGGPTTVSQYGFSPEQMDLGALRQIPEERITAVIGVPAIVAGLGAGLDRSTFANMAEAREMAYETTLIPTQRLMASELQTQLLPDFARPNDRLRVTFDWSKVRVLQEDENRKATRWGEMVRGGYVTVAEARRAQGLEAKSTDEVYLRPLAMVEIPVGQAAPLLRPVVGTAGAKMIGTKATRQEGRLIQILGRDAIGLENVFAVDLAKAFQALGAAAGDAAAIAEGVTVAQLVAALDIPAWEAENLLPAYRAHYLRTIQITLSSLNAVFEFGVNLPDPAQARILELGGKRMGLLDITKDTRQAIFTALAEGRELGEGPPALARRIKDQVSAGRFTQLEAAKPGSGSRARANLIARSETKYAQNVSSIEGYLASGVVSGLLAFDAQLGATDEECEARDGQVFTFDEASDLTEREHANGTLNFAPVVG